MCKLLEDNFHRLGILRGKVKGVSNNIFLIRNVPPDFGVLSVDLESELELELIQSQMAQKPMLRGEVGRACAMRCVVRDERGGIFERGGTRRSSE